MTSYKRYKNFSQGTFEGLKAKNKFSTRISKILVRTILEAGWGHGRFGARSWLERCGVADVGFSKGRRPGVPGCKAGTRFEFAGFGFLEFGCRRPWVVLCCRLRVLLRFPTTAARTSVSFQVRFCYFPRLEGCDSDIE